VEPGEADCQYHREGPECLHVETKYQKDGQLRQRDKGRLNLHDFLRIHVEGHLDHGQDSPRYRARLLATQKGYKTRFFSAADL
jgi:hypothetical protein